MPYNTAANVRGRLRPLGKQIGTHTIVLADVRQRNRAGKGGGCDSLAAGPFAGTAA